MSDANLPVRLACAPSFAEAGPHDLLCLDPRGQVISPAEARRRARPKRMVMMALGGAAGLGLYGLMSVSPAFGLLWFVLVGRWWFARRFVRLVSQGTLLVHQGRYDEAEAELRQALRARLVGETSRGAAWLLFADVARYRGELGEALSRVRRARRAVSGHSLLGQVASHLEILTLSDLDQVDEAERLFAERHRVVPEGDYLRASHWMVELYLAMARGSHRLSAAELERRTAALWPLRTARVMLALLAWAYQALGDAARARELLAEAFERHERFPIDKVMPRLQEWIEANRDPRAALPP